MLVKLGDAWVDPAKVDSIEEEANKCCGEYASIVNLALITQSFGGQSNEEDPAQA